MSEIRAGIHFALTTTGLEGLRAASAATRELAAATRALRQAGGRGAGGAANNQGGGVSAGVDPVVRAARTRAAGVKAAVSVETEMQRLQNLAARRKMTSEARERLHLEQPLGGFLRGHGMTDRLRASIGAMRDVTVAAYGVRAGISMIGGAANTVLDPLREFQSHMADVRNKGGFSKEQTDAIAAVAKAQGRNTQFAPTQAAAAAVELAAAGLGAKDIGTAMPSVLRFAQAGGMGTEQASSTMVETGAQFGLNASQYERIGNIMVKAANLSTISVGDLSESLKYVGPIAAAAGQSLEFTAGTIALLGERGIKGSEGGTGLRTMLASLVKPSKQAKSALQTLGLSKKDLQKGIDDLPGFMRQLDAKMAGHKFNKAQRLETLQRLFGREGMTVAQVLMKAAVDNGGKAWQDYTDQVSNATTAMKDAAAIAGDTLDGKMAKLHATIETGAISLGEKFVPMLDRLIPKLTSAALATGDWVEKNGDLVTGGAKFALAAGGTALAMKGASMVGGLASALLPEAAVAAASAAGMTLGATFAAAVGTAIASYSLTTAVLGMLDIDMEKVGARIYEMLNGEMHTKEGVRTHSTASMIASQKSKKASDETVNYTAQGTPFAQTLDINIMADGKMRAALRGDAGPVDVKTKLRTGTNVGAP